MDASEIVASIPSNYLQLKEQFWLAETNSHFGGGMGRFYLLLQKRKCLSIESEAHVEHKLTKQKRIGVDSVVYPKRGSGSLDLSISSFWVSSKTRNAHVHNWKQYVNLKELRPL